MLATSCIYPYVFETPPPETAQKMRRYDRVPNPFALYAGTPSRRVVDEGETLSVELTVFGNASRHLAYFVRAFEVAGRSGLGSRRVSLSLIRAEVIPHRPSEAPETIYAPEGVFALPTPTEAREPPCPGRVTVEILTPLRLKEHGDLVVPDRFAARHMLSSLVRRISMLMYFHTEEPLSAGFAGLRTRADQIETFDLDLRWLDLTRKSSRQGTVMQMGGIVGTVGIDLGEAEDLWPYLWLGQITQLGKGTTMGLGRYRIVDGAVKGVSSRGDFS